VRLATGQLLADTADFDRQPHLLNVRNGVVDLRTGELMPHDPALMMMKLADADYEAAAEHPDWKAALQALPDDVRDWYQVRMGQATTGEMTPDDLMLVQVGSGENGKTTVMSAFGAVLGTYYHVVSHRALLADARAIDTEVADFQGVRLAVMEETPEEHRLSPVRLKRLVGTPEITARHLYHDGFTFTATHSLVVSTNYAPAVAETDHGTWRRLAMVRFPYKWLKPGQEPASETERPGDPGLRRRLKLGRAGQHAAILAWLVAGAVTYYAEYCDRDLAMPPLPARVEADTLRWRTDNDVVMAYWDDRLVADPGRNIPGTDLLGDFNAWLGRRGLKEWSDKLFVQRFREHEVTTGNHVSYDRTRNRSAASRPEWPGDLSERYRAWLGVKFAEFVK
jgi:putative DNA primase/helicase